LAGSSGGLKKYPCANEQPTSRTIRASSDFTTSTNFALGSSTSYINTNGFNGTVNGSVNGSGNLDKNGNGTLTLNSNSTYNNMVMAFMTRSKEYPYWTLTSSVVASSYTHLQDCLITQRNLGAHGFAVLIVSSFERR